MSFFLQTIADLTHDLSHYKCETKPHFSLAHTILLLRTSDIVNLRIVQCYDKRNTHDQSR